MMLDQDGSRLWNHAKSVIPGGNQLLSKRAERFLPDQWPSYYRRARGFIVWDTQGREFRDFAQMGVGACVLGYADPDVNAAVIDAVQNGSMTSLNCPEEIELAETLIELHPWAEMARFARSGGEACAIAVRIARSATGRDKVAFCGYHGWHDWYLASNLADTSNLDGQLLPGLAPRGVPRGLVGTALPFNYGRIDELEEIARVHGDSLAAIIMEPVRSSDPPPGFLDAVRQISNRVGAVLIFDEITSGFRINVGGAHMKYKVYPDICVLGKALGNGFPISAVIGTRAVMDAAQDTFISSTFWTERVGSAAALATISKMLREDVPNNLMRYGDRINRGWRAIADEHDLEISISGIPPLTHISFGQSEPMVLQTLYAQEMLELGYLLGASVYACNAYNDESIDRFIQDSSLAFGRMSAALRSGDPKSKLKGPIIQMGFRRLA